MAKKKIKTIDIARAVGVHPNTIRVYEELGYLPPIPRAENKYRQYTRLHLEHAKLVRLALEWPFVADRRDLLVRLVQSAAQGDYGMAMERAYQYLAAVRVERTYAEAAVEFVERWASGHLIDTRRERLTTKAAAEYLDVTVDMLRNWERSGLIDVPRDPISGYRMYGTSEFGRLRVIRILLRSGYSQMAILQMMLRFDAGERENLRDALTVVPHEDDTIDIIADRWLSSLLSLETRALQTIHQITLLMSLSLEILQPV